MMFDEEHFKAHDKLESIQKLLTSLEAISWLHNCTKIQIGKGLISHTELAELGFWMTMRHHKIYYSKNKD